MTVAPFGPAELAVLLLAMIGFPVGMPLLLMSVPVLMLFCTTVRL